MKHTIASIICAQQTFFNTRQTYSICFRTAQLRTLKKLLTDNRESLLQALTQDLGKSHFEGYTTELFLVLQEIDYALRNICTWTSKKAVKTPWILKPARSYLQPEPHGKILIIAPWNYPLLLTLMPAVGAIAAGNCIIIKPSEYAPHTSNLLAQLINSHFETGLLHVMQGDQHTAQELLHHRFDYIFFTGSTSVGRHIMHAAAHHLTPLTLELGGKCPLIVHHDADIQTTAQKIVWAKYLNAGQSCIAPDYLLVHHSIKQPLIDQLIKYIQTFYGSNAAHNSAFGRIINAHHVERIAQLISNTSIIYGGTIERESRYIEPTLVDTPPLDSHIMHEEIFGPVLPIISYNTPDEALAIINNLPHPLAVYLFTFQDELIELYKRRTTSGSISINDILIHAASAYLPFGGVGTSGFGTYHGKKTFDLFSHYKSIFHKTRSWDFLLRYPPYTSLHTYLLRYLQWIHR